MALARARADGKGPCKEERDVKNELDGGGRDHASRFIPRRAASTRCASAGSHVAARAVARARTPLSIALTDARSAACRGGVRACPDAGASAELAQADADAADATRRRHDQ
eukprot:3128072-Pleurochrysis_carterae.AAC.1